MLFIKVSGTGPGSKVQGPSNVKKLLSDFPCTLNLDFQRFSDRIHLRFNLRVDRTHFRLDHAAALLNRLVFLEHDALGAIEHVTEFIPLARDRLVVVGIQRSSACRTTSRTTSGRSLAMWPITFSAMAIVSLIISCSAVS